MAKKTKLSENAQLVKDVLKEFLPVELRIAQKLMSKGITSTQLDDIRKKELAFIPDNYFLAVYNTMRSLERGNMTPKDVEIASQLHF